MQREGAFAWWYADLVDDRGRAMVLIWSFGLPFLPASRACPRPADRPSLSLALYEGERPSFYALEAYAPADAAWRPGGEVRLGRSRFVLDMDDEAVQLRVELDLSVPGGGRLRGTVEASGPRAHAPREVPTDAHRWAPILLASPGRARLVTDGGRRFDLDGRIYVDSNGSDLPLHQLGIADWRWGRVAFPDRELIYYFVDPVEGGGEPIRLVIEGMPDGRLVTRDDVSLRWVGRRSSLYGLDHPRRLRLTSEAGLDVAVAFRARVDDGPFYQRFLVDAEDEVGQRGRGVAERVVPERIDRSWQRPFLRMRTHEVGGGNNSMWLPLFSGPRFDRLERLFRSWVTTDPGSSTEVAS